jgi:hypothetical protein
MADLRTLIRDKMQPLDVRIDAVEKFSRESGEYKRLCDLLLPIIDSEEEDPVLRSASLAALSARHSAASMQLLLRPFENPSVRRAAIEILDKLAPITGEQEVLLTAELSALHGTLTHQKIETLPLGNQWKQILSANFNQLNSPNHEVNRSCMTINLARRCGRDPRVLAFLKEELHQPVENRRRDAVFGLCMLGELQTALDAVNDPSPVVRSTLASRLGYYREAGGTEVLQRLLEDSAPNVAKEAKAALRLLNKLEMPQSVEQPPRSSAWGQLLTEISRIQLADRRISAEMLDQKITTGWLGETGATETEIASAEQRLGVQFPPSYRAFLAESNGFEHIGPFIYKL